MQCIVLYAKDPESSSGILFSRLGTPLAAASHALAPTTLCLTPISISPAIMEPLAPSTRRSSTVFPSDLSVKA